MPPPPSLYVGDSDSDAAPLEASGRGSEESEGPPEFECYMMEEVFPSSKKEIARQKQLKQTREAEMEAFYKSITWAEGLLEPAAAQAAHDQAAAYAEAVDPSVIDHGAFTWIMLNAITTAEFSDTCFKARRAALLQASVDNQDILLACTAGAAQAACKVAFKYRLTYTAQQHVPFVSQLLLRGLPGNCQLYQTIPVRKIHPAGWEAAHWQKLYAGRDGLDAAAKDGLVWAVDVTKLRQLIFWDTHASSDPDLAVRA